MLRLPIKKGDPRHLHRWHSRARKCSAHDTSPCASVAFIHSQVFMAKSDPDADTANGEEGPKTYILLARAGNEVQEIEVQANLNRDKMKTALSVALSSII